LRVPAGLHAASSRLLVGHCAPEEEDGTPKEQDGTPEEELRTLEEEARTDLLDGGALLAGGDGATLLVGMAAPRLLSGTRLRCSSRRRRPASQPVVEQCIGTRLIFIFL
jgi:hypothetical protein